MIDGTLQTQRALPVQTERRFAVDSLRLDQLVALCRRLAKRLRFVDLNNQDVGNDQDGSNNWSVLFDHDETLVLARIAGFDHAARRMHFDQLCDTEGPQSLLKELLALAAILDRWHDALEGSTQDAALIVREAIGQMQGQLQEPPSIPEHKSHGAELRGRGLSILHVIQRTQVLAAAHLNETLDGGQHEPAAGLLLVFLRLYGLVQTQVNGFADRHIDFYYRRVLGMTEQPPRPDQVHVACQTDPRLNHDVLVPTGTLFAAGKSSRGDPLLFRATEGLAVTDAQVVQLATLRLVRDNTISPECTMNYVTSVKAQWLGLPGPDHSPVPLFGGNPGGPEADLGLAIASPLLLLQEGERVIDVELRLAWPKSTKDMLADHVNAATLAADPDDFRHALGQVFACWLLGDGTALSDAQGAKLVQRAQDLDVSLGRELAAAEDLGIDAPAVLRMCSGAPSDKREVVFYKLIDALFDVSLSKADGWLAADRVQITPASPGGQGGLHLRITLRTEDPAVVACNPAVHGAQWPTRLPVLRLQISSRASIHPYSLFESAVFLGADLQVSASGVRQLKLHNQLGLLDAGKSFAPFGPLPSTASYLVLGSPEAAGKPLDRLSLNLRWSGLPDEPGGWATYYADYGQALKEGQFAARLSLLQNGQWYPCGGASAEQALFAPPAGDDHLLQPDMHIDVDAVSVRERATGGSEPLDNIFAARNGLLRLQLNQPRGAFGHAQYPELLSQAVASRSWRRGTQVLPRPPYTPELESISLDYSARSRIGAHADVGKDNDIERLLHIHPSGVSDMAASGGRQEQRLLPPLGPDGNLYIGLKASVLRQPLTLYFNLRPQTDNEVADDEAPADIQWACLSNNRWVPLADRDVRADGTFGLLTSGVVTLDVPEVATQDNRLLGGGLYWLRLSATRLLDSASCLVSVHAQALALERVLGLADPADIAPMPMVVVPAATINAPEVPVPGLAGVLQAQASSGLRPAETVEQLRTRVGERLRHKNRASLGWDFERLVLAQFPEVYKVRCFSWSEVRAHHEQLKLSDPEIQIPTPGTVVLVVVPTVTRNDPATATTMPRLDTLSLRRIRQTLMAQMPASASLKVRNARYERVQVRCRVLLQPGAVKGVVQRALDRAITEYLSPWFDEGFGPRFDWSLGCDEVETRLRQVPGVAEVAGLSLLHVTRGSHAGIDRYYRLEDTADRTPEDGHTLSCHVPWSLALPLAEHLIEFVDQMGVEKPQVTGLNRLRVGETFVISKNGGRG
ncbi:MAG: baseplate J/gp47 family protein [Leptothrix sp. (in: b-proteobacteria)]